MDALGGEQGFDSRTGSAKESNVTNLEGVGGGQAPVTFKTSFKTAIVNRKSAMLLLSQVESSLPIVLHVHLLPPCSFSPPRHAPLPPPSTNVSACHIHTRLHTNHGLL